MNLLELALHGKFCAHRGGRYGIPVQQIVKRFICLVLILLVQLWCDVLVAMSTGAIAYCPLRGQCASFSARMA